MNNNWYDVIDNFYKLKTSCNIEEGDIVYCVCSYNEPDLRVLDSARNSTTEHKDIIGNICGVDFSKHFTSEKKLPIKLLNIKDTEEIILKKAKLRPCIVLKIIKRKHIGIELNTDDLFLLLPLYSLTNSTGFEYKFNEKIVAKLKSLYYPEYFYFPKKVKGYSPFYKDSFLRFEEMFLTYSKHMHRTTKDSYCISKELLNILLEIYKLYFCGLPLSEDVDTIIMLARESLADEYK